MDPIINGKQYSADMTASELVNHSDFEPHHTAWSEGYISRYLEEGLVRVYSGRFGDGYILSKPSWESTRFHRRTYYVHKG